MGQQLLFLQIKTKHQILKGVSVKETKRWGGGRERERQKAVEFRLWACWSLEMGCVTAG